MTCKMRGLLYMGVLGAGLLTVIGCGKRTETHTYSIHREIKLRVANSLVYNPTDVHTSLGDIVQECARHDPTDRVADEISKEVLGVMEQIRSKIEAPWPDEEAVSEIPYDNGSILESYFNDPSSVGEKPFLLPPYIPDKIKKEVGMLQRFNHPYATMLGRMLESFSYSVIEEITASCNTTVSNFDGVSTHNSPFTDQQGNVLIRWWRVRHYPGQQKAVCERVVKNPSTLSIEGIPDGLLEDEHE